MTSPTDGRIRSHLQPGQQVEIVLKKDQRSGRLTRGVVKDILKERSRAGMTVFVSTHQLSLAEEMADRIGIIHQGRLVAVGTRDELRRQSGVPGPLEDAFLALTRDEELEPGEPSVHPS